MNVFCNRKSCIFHMNEQCRTSAISVSSDGCVTYQARVDEDGNPARSVFWGHLVAHPDPGVEPDDGTGTG